MILLACCLTCCVQMYFSHKTKIVAIQEESDVYKNKADEEYRAKTILVQTNKELKKSNDSLYAEYKKIKKDDPLIITKTILETRVDTLPMETVIVHSSPNEYHFNWSYSENVDNNNYFRIGGHTTTDSLMSVAATSLDSMSLGADLKLNVVKSEADNALRIVARSNNPRVKITQMEGVVLDPTKNELIKSYFPPKRWGVGVGLGVGVGYDITGKRVSVGPQVTVGINYNLFNW